MSKNCSNSNVISEKNHRGLFAFIVAALISTTAYDVQAAIFLWNNTGTQWTSDTSWVGGVQPAATSSSATTDEVQFGNVGVNFNAVDMTSTRAVKNFTFLTGANAYTVGTTSAKLLEINGGLTNNSTATQTFNLVVNNANNNNTWTQTTGGTMVFNNTVNLTTGSSSTSRSLTLAGNGTFTFNSSLNNGGSATGGKVVVNGAGGTVNLKAANALGGGFTVSAGTVNFYNAAALGTGTLELGNTTGALYGNSVLNNASGSAVTLGNSAVVWSGTPASGVGVQIGTAASTSANNINFGSGLVTASTSRNMNIAGTGVTLSMGTLNSTSDTSSNLTFTINGVGNTLVFGGYNIRANAPTSLDSRIDDLAGTANLTITGEIQNGNIYSNGLRVRGTGVTTFSGNNTYDGMTTMNAAGGTLTLSGNNSGAGGGVTLTAGTLNINNNNALGTGALSLAGTGATINNTSGSAVVNAGNQAWTWTDGLAFGASGNTAANNLNLGTGVVTVDGTRTINLAGSGTKLTIGAVNVTSTSSGRNFTANGVGNTLEMGGLTLSASATPVTVTLAGTANLGVTGAIVNGTTPGNGLTVTATGTTTLSGNNTYTGLTTMNAAGGTLTLSGNNSGAAGGVTLTAGTLNLNNANAVGTGLLELSAVAGTAYGSSIINNTSGGALTFSGLSGVRWFGTAAAAGLAGNGIQFGTAESGAANSMDFGSAVVTATTSRQMNVAGSGVTISMGRLDSTSASGSRTFTFDGAGNSVLLRGYKITTSATAATSGTLDGSANLEIAGVIENGNLLANGVVIKGTGAKTFSGANTYTGETEIASGATLNYGANDVTLDTGGRMYVNGGTLNIGSYRDTVSSVRVTAGGVINGTGTLTTAGSFALVDNNVVNANLAGAMTISKSGAGLTSLLNGNNTYSGTTTVNSGILKLGSNTALGSPGAGTTTSSGGFLDLNGKTVGAEALTFTGSGGLLNSSGTAASLSGNVAIGDATTVNTTADITLSGNLTGTSSKILTKEGAGTLKLSSSGSTLAGTLKVSEGTLLVTGNGNVSTSSSIVDGGTLRVNGTAGTVTVNASGTLEGTGTVGTTTVAGTLKPGNSPGVLNVNGNLTMASGGNMVWELFANTATQSSPAVFDQVLVSGDLAFAGSNGITLNFGTTADGSTVAWSDSFWSSNRSFLIYDVAGSTTGFSNLSLLNTSFNDATGAALAESQGNFTVSQLGSDVFLNYNAIPEPSTGSMLGLGFAGLVVTRLLRRKSS